MAASLGKARRRTKGACALAWASFVLVGVRDARAGDTHYHDYPIGDRAVGLGGAFVALGSDPSGIFYNPAGIADGTKHSIQLSTNLYGLQINDSFFSAARRVADLDTVIAELNVVPSSAGFIDVISEDEKGGTETSYGLGAFVPSFRTVSIKSLGATGDDAGIAGCGQIAYQRNTLDRTFHLGAAIGHRVDETWRFGASVFAAYRALRDQEQTSCFSGETAATTSFADASTDLDLGVASLMFGFGIKAQATSELSLGLSLMSPGIDVFDFAGVRVRRSAANALTGDSAFFLDEFNDGKADTGFPARVRAGAAYVIPYTATFALDLSLNAPTSYTLVEIPADQQTIRDAVTLITDIKRKLVVNLHLGAEYLFVKTFSLSGGFFTNFTSAPGVPGEAGALFEEDRLAHLDALGGAVVLGFFGEHTLTRIGLTMSYGSGADVVPRTQGIETLGGRTDYVKVDLNQLFVFLFVGSTFRY